MVTVALPPPACPGCGSIEAWHGVIVEPVERDRVACDECGLVVEVGAWCDAEHDRGKTLRAGAAVQ